MQQSKILEASTLLIVPRVFVIMFCDKFSWYRIRRDSDLKMRLKLMTESRIWGVFSVWLWAEGIRGLARRTIGEDLFAAIKIQLIGKGSPLRIEANWCGQAAGIRYLRMYF
jgi:hypothetical protein